MRTFLSKKLFFTLVGILFLFIPWVFVQADFTLHNPLDPIRSFPGLICLFARVVFWFAFPLALLALLMAALLFLVSGGNEQRLRQAKDALFYSIIGWGIVIIAQAIALSMVALIGGRPLSFTGC